MVWTEHEEKPKPALGGLGNEESCEAESRIVVVPVIVEPVPVQHDLPVVLDEVRGVQVAIAVPNECTEFHPCHHPWNTLRVESYAVSEIP